MKGSERIAVAGMLVSAACATATTLPAGFEDAVYTSGLSDATAMEFAPDGRLFVCEQGGTLRIVQKGVPMPNTFLALTVDSDGERGLLGIAFDPAFPANGYLYAYYTVPGSPAHNRVSRFTAAGDSVVPGSEVALVDLDNLSNATNHNGGAIHFGLDGKLYIAVGENANSSNAQTLNNRLGKMLRIDRDGSIPADNPFYNTATGANRAIWALGLRNPFTFDVQPATGRIFINDVGQSQWEEINDGIAGSNYGWPNREGITNDPLYRDPLYAYKHTNGDPTGCAIAGGAFYNSDFRQFPDAFQGKYFFADHCSRWIWNYDPATNTASQFATGLSGETVDLKVGPDGSLYYLDHGTGGGGFVGRIRYAAGVYGLSDATIALRIAAGLDAGSPAQLLRLNVADTGASQGIVDLHDAVRIAQVVTG